MFTKPFPLILGLLAFFIIMPLVVHFPIYFFRFFRMRRIAMEKGPQFKPSTTLLALNIWFLVALVGFILSIRNTLNFDTKAKQAEAKTNLGAIYMAQVSYFGEHNTFAGRKGEDGSGAFADLGWKPQGDTVYTYYVGDDFILPTKAYAKSAVEPLNKIDLKIRPEVSNHGFTVLAIGNIDRDPFLDIWMINDANEILNLADDPSDHVNEDIGANQGASSPSSPVRKWLDLIVWIVVSILIAIYVIISITSPAIFVVIPIMYYLAIKQNRLYEEALAAMAEKEPHL